MSNAPAEAGRVRLYYIGQSVESHAVRGDEPSRTECGRVLSGVDRFTVRLGQPSCQVCYARLQRLASDWADELMAGVPPVTPNPHYHCATQDRRPCPTGEHVNPAPVPESVPAESPRS